jgi:hypothetical protein
MRDHFLAPILTLALPLTAQAEPQGSETVFLEMTASSLQPYRQQAIRVQVRIGVDQAFARDQLIQRFRTQLDLPIQVEAPWLERLPGTRRVQIPPSQTSATSVTASSGGPSIAVNQAEEIALRLPDQRRNGRPFTVIQIERMFIPERIGPLKLPPVTLQYAYAKSFREDLLRGRIPLDSQNGLVQGPITNLEVRALPTAKRPATFSGAIGRFQISTQANRRSIAAGDPFRLTLRIQGQGNFGAFQMPGLAGHPALHVLGQVEQSSPSSQTVLLDIKAEAGVEEIPSIPFSFFELDDNGTGHYETIRSSPIRLEVRGDAPRSEASRTPGVDDIFSLKLLSNITLESIIRSSSSWQVLLLLCGLPWLLSVGLRSMQRRRQRSADPARRRARTAQGIFLAAMAVESPDLGNSLITYLAARLACPPAAIISPDLGAKLEAAGIDSELAQTAAACTEQLLAGQYGGDTNSSEPSLEAVKSLAAALEANFRHSSN